jgi:hypothetical protein
MWKDYNYDPNVFEHRIGTIDKPREHLDRN